MLRDFEFEVAFRTDVYAERRGLGQLVHDACGLSTPVSLNRYTYAANNPLVYWDPTGRYTEYIEGLDGPTLRGQMAEVDDMTRKRTVLGDAKRDVRDLTEDLTAAGGALNRLEVLAARESSLETIAVHEGTRSAQQLVDSAVATAIARANMLGGDGCGFLPGWVCSVGVEVVTTPFEIAAFAGDRIADEFYDFLIDPDLGDVPEILTNVPETVVDFTAGVLALVTGGDLRFDRCPPGATYIDNSQLPRVWGRSGWTLNEVIVTTPDASLETKLLHEPQHFYDVDQDGLFVFGSAYLAGAITSGSWYKGHFSEERANEATRTDRRLDPWTWADVRGESRGKGWWKGG